MSRKIAVVGNDSFPIDAAVGAQVVDLLRTFGQDCTILTRKRPMFDQFVQAVSIALGVRCLTYDADGGLTNMERDAAIVKSCDELHAFFNLDEFEVGRESGTGWLVERALKAGKPAHAYAAVDGALVHVMSPEQVE